MKKYAAYKPSGVEWLGKVPAHWEVKRLKFVCSLWAQYGLNESAESYQNEGVRFLRTSDIDDFGSLLGEGVCLPEETVRGYELEDGDLLISRSGTIGRSFLYSRKKHGRCSFAGYLVRYSPTAELIPLFAFYFTKTVAYATFLTQVSISATIGNVNGQKFANMTLPIPPLPEQRAIVAFLDERTAHLDGLIQRKEDLLKLLAEQRAALITRAVTRGLDAAAPLQDSGVSWLGQVPAHWQVKRLKFALEAINPVGSKLPLPDDASVSFVPMTAVGEYGGLTLDMEKPLDEIGNGYTYFAENDVIVAKITPCFENGKGALANGLTNGVAFGTTELHVLRANEQMDVQFLFLLTISTPFRQLGEGEMIGAGGQKRVPEEFIKNLMVPLPPISEQRKIVVATSSINKRLDKMTDITTREIEKLREYRAALITAAVTGRIDVRAAVAVPELVEA